MPLVENGEGLCNPVYIDDAVDALILAGTRPEALGERFLISGATPVTWKEFYGAYEQVLGLQSTAPMTMEDLLQEREKERKRSSLPCRLKSVAVSSEVFPLIASLPPIPTALRAARRILSQHQWEALKNRVFSQNASSLGNGAHRRPIHLPSDLLLSLYQSRSRVCIDKARKMLGYSPKYSFRRGMEITGEFIRWANL